MVQKVSTKQIRGSFPALTASGLIAACDGRGTSAVKNQLQVFQGANAGYFSGYQPASNYTSRFPFAVDEDASSHGKLAEAQNGTLTKSSGASSATHGYAAGCGKWGKYPFAVAETSSSSGGLAISPGTCWGSGQSSINQGYGYHSGGGSGTVGVCTTAIQKWPFAADTSATCVGDLNCNCRFEAGYSSITDGFTISARTVQKFPFASDGNSTEIGTLSPATYANAGTGVSSLENGYSWRSTIIQFSFASAATSTCVGASSQPGVGSSGLSGATHGYFDRCRNPAFYKFPYTSGSGATVVGNLTFCKGPNNYSAGSQC